MSCVDLFEFILLGTLYTSCTWISVSFFRFGKFGAIISSNTFSTPSSLLLLESLFCIDWHTLNYPIGLLYCFHFFFFYLTLCLLFWLNNFHYSVVCVCVCVCVCTQLLQSCLILCNGLLPARLLYSWNSPGKNTGVVATFSFRGSSWPRDQTCISCIAGVFFTHWATWEAHSILQITYLFFCIIQSAVLCI